MGVRGLGLHRAAIANLRLGRGPIFLAIGPRKSWRDGSGRTHKGERLWRVAAYRPAPEIRVEEAVGVNRRDYPNLVWKGPVGDGVIDLKYVTHTQRTHAASSLVKNTSPQ
jgi:hypothetical protein